MRPIRDVVTHVICILLFLPGFYHAEGLFTEELLLRPLPDGSVLVYFHFETSAVGHEDLLQFPAAVAQLAAKTQVQHFDAALTHGRWFEDRWGKPPLPAASVGAQLRARFLLSKTLKETSDRWAALVHSLSGLLCASFNLLEGSDVVSHPAHTFPKASAALAGGWTYGALPREVVCTENLTPWLKLLPCRGSAGLTSLMDRPSLYGAQYHSMTTTLTVTPLGSGPSPGTSEIGSTSPVQNGQRGGRCCAAGSGAQVDYKLVQTLTLVLGPKHRGGWPHAVRPLSAGNYPAQGWSLEALFAGRKLSGRCRHAALSKIHVQLPVVLLRMLESQHTDGTVAVMEQQHAEHGSDRTNGSAIDSPKSQKESSGTLNNPSPENGTIGYGMSRQSDSSGSDGEGGKVLTFEVPLEGASMQHIDLSQRLGQHDMGWPVSKPSVSAERYLTGWGDEHGIMVLIVRSLQPHLNETKASGVKESVGSVQVCLFQMVPWLLQLWLHTLQVAIDGQVVNQRSVVTSRQLRPAESRSAGAVIELCMAVPADFQHISLRVEFSKAFLTVFEHPPDAARGLDIPAAIVTIKREQQGDLLPGSNRPLDRYLIDQSYDQVSSPGSLVQLAQPDFSMPYNVACMTCTLLAVCLGTLMNTLFRKSEADMTDAEVMSVAAKRKRKALAIVVIFAAAAVYLDKGLQRTIHKFLGASGYS